MDKSQSVSNLIGNIFMCMYKYRQESWMCMIGDFVYDFVQQSMASCLIGEQIFLAQYDLLQ